jgi:hypothetical protein
MESGLSLVEKSPRLVPILSQMNPVPAFRCDISKINCTCNMIFPPSPVSEDHSTQSCVHVSFLPSDVYCLFCHRNCHNNGESYGLIYEHETSQTVVLCLTPYIMVRDTYVVETTLLCGTLSVIVSGHPFDSAHIFPHRI